MPHKITIEIRFSDIDKLGHVNNAKYLTYIEHARVKYFENFIGNSIEWSQKGIILAKAEIEFLQPILLEDHIEITTQVSRIGNKSFDMTYELNKIENNRETLVAKAKTILVCFSYPDSQTIPIPPEWEQKFRLLENLI